MIQLDGRREQHNPYTGEREFIVYTQDYGTIFRYNPYNSPCEIHREYQAVAA